MMSEATLSASCGKVSMLLPLHEIEDRIGCVASRLLDLSAILNDHADRVQGIQPECSAADAKNPEPPANGMLERIGKALDYLERAADAVARAGERNTRLA